MTRAFRVMTLGILMVLAGCDLAPHYARPASSAPERWPRGAAYGPSEPGTPRLPWRALIGDPKLRAVIEEALANNRDLRAAIANVASARAQYHVQRSLQFPAITASGGATLTGDGDHSHDRSNDYVLTAGISGFEIDLFGRLRDQARQGFEAYLATESGSRATRLTIVAETATAYVTLASDRDHLAVAGQTVSSAQRSLELTQSLFHAGLAPAGDVESATTTLEQARSDLAAYTNQVAQDRNALELLVGAPMPEALFPAGLDALDRSIAVTPAGVSSKILLDRPDVVEAEHQLKSANQAIGAARAAFFPTIDLTAGPGLASAALSALFTGGALTWSVQPSMSLPLFGGPTRGNLEFAKAQRDHDLALYEKAVQSAFTDVADGLARQGTIAGQRQAQDRLVVAATRASAFADARYRAGTGPFLDALVAQRTLYSARQNQIGVVVVDVSNRISLYRALGADASL
jgi:multidrug efflux system outer membrane protein